MAVSGWMGKWHWGHVPSSQRGKFNNLREENKYCLCSYRGFPGGASGKELACQCRRAETPLGWEDPLEEEMATHSCILAWKIPWTEEPGRLQSGGIQSIGSQRLGPPLRDWACLLCILLSGDKLSPPYRKRSIFILHWLSSSHYSFPLSSLHPSLNDTQILKNKYKLRK